MRYPNFGRPVWREHVADVEADELGEAQTGAEGERDDCVFPEVASGRAKDEALLVGGQRSRGEVRHGGLLAAHVPSVGEKVKGTLVRFPPPDPKRVTLEAPNPPGRLGLCR